MEEDRPPMTIDQVVLGLQSMEQVALKHQAQTQEIGDALKSLMEHVYQPKLTPQPEPQPQPQPPSQYMPKSKYRGPDLPKFAGHLQDDTTMEMVIKSTFTFEQATFKNMTPGFQKNFQPRPPNNPIPMDLGVLNKLSPAEYFDVILGQPWILEYQPLPDWTKMTLFLPKTSQTLAATDLTKP
ncbi:hypothetical protein H4R33_007012 [Dimargaris cristalligena]|nr:hypothetical protein H4R33_007012 [Dimargaris cristalligena]